MKLFQFTPSLQMARTVYAVAAILCGLLLTLGIVFDNTTPWLTAADGFLVGFNVAGALFTSYVIRADERFNRMHAMFDSMGEMNQQLIEDKVQFIMEGREDEAPTGPRLH